ncbi:MAG TPA: hypothetical protein VFT31_00765 [Kribbella sp.]|nr:hypothetical protein [Kribbella sp.]
MLLYSTYLGLGITLPGTLLWRWLRGNVDGFVMDVAFGTGLGFVASILAYIPGRAIGVPLLPLVVPVATVLAFIALPGLRRHWRSRQAPLPLWWGWAVAAACVLGLGVIARYGLMVEPLTFPDAAFQYSDMSYQLALAGELKHHMPGQIPYVIGQELNYHWFFHAEAAAANWQTGLELDLLLRRLLPVTTALVPIVSVAALTTRLARQSWAGPVAAWLLLLVSSLDVYGWNGSRPVAQAGFSSGVLMYSQTHAFAVVLALPVVWLVLSLLRGEGARRTGNWILLAVGLAGLAGAKASFVPLLMTALALVVVVQLLLQRRVDRAVVGVATAAVIAFGFAQVVLFSAGSSGVALSPGQTFVAMSSKFGFGGHDDTRPAVALMVGATAATLLVSWSIAGLGMLGFLRQKRWKDPAVVFLLGFLVAALAAVTVFRHPGYSQLYFVRAAFPVAIVASGWGLTVLLSGVRLRALVPRMVGAFGLGLLLARALAALTRDRPNRHQGVLAISWQVVWPWLAVLVLAGAIAFAARRRRLSQGLGLGVLLVLGVSSLSVPTTIVEAIKHPVCVSGPDRSECRHPPRQIPAGGETAARYVRDHSAVGDRLATNSHCSPAYQAKACDARNFWLSAYAERRVLVEGWAYTPIAQSRTDSRAAISGPFWDQPLLAANDRVFQDPSRADLDYLRNNYGVRWLVFDLNVTRPSAELKQLLPLRFGTGAVEVYELVPIPDGPSVNG